MAAMGQGMILMLGVNRRMKRPGSALVALGMQRREMRLRG